MSWSCASLQGEAKISLCQQHPICNNFCRNKYPSFYDSTSDTREKELPGVSKKRGNLSTEIRKYLGLVALHALSYYPTVTEFYVSTYLRFLTV